MAKPSEAILEELLERVKGLEHQAEIMKTVLIVKEPTSIPAAEAFEGLRKVVLASNRERRSHVTQLVQMAVAVARASSVEDLAQRVDEWLAQAGIVRVMEPPDAVEPEKYFNAESGGLDGPLEIVEPAYVDEQFGQLIKAGLARRRVEPLPDAGPAPVPAG